MNKEEARSPLRAEGGMARTVSRFFVLAIAVPFWIVIGLPIWLSMIFRMAIVSSLKLMVESINGRATDNSLIALEDAARWWPKGLTIIISSGSSASRTAEDEALAQDPQRSKRKSAWNDRSLLFRAFLELCWAASLVGFILFLL
ncbi:hypothetical protein [Puniceibacterium sp. IMCC21224]|uniref:hypothetical protein n=1 Tax=Puniceibacterium sp. IMCC21224 TaxID=1618204 RepID=UPI0012E0059E|nr:hypothetical protein [Puniceibacterium sp. IMCC21224]